MKSSSKQTPEVFVMLKREEPLTGGPSIMSLLELEKLSLERAKTRRECELHALAEQDGQQKFGDFVLFMNGGLESGRGQSFYAYYHLEDGHQTNDSDDLSDGDAQQLHRLQHEAFLRIFGIREITVEEIKSPSQDVIVKLDDPDNPTVAITRQAIVHDGVLFGVRYTGIRIG